MSKKENSKPKEYYAELIIFSNQIFITNKLNKIMKKKVTKVNEIKNQNILLLFSISQKLNYDSCNQNELTYIFDN
jgi:flagellar biosynthesis regulator FlaF